MAIISYLPTNHEEALVEYIQKDRSVFSYRNIFRTNFIYAKIQLFRKVCTNEENKIWQTQNPTKKQNMNLQMP